MSERRFERFNPSRVVATELLVPLQDPPERPRTPLPDPDVGPRRRWSPRKSWPELRAIDEKLDDLDRRRADLGARLGQLREELRAATRADKEALAEWQLDGAQTPRPEPTAPRVDAELELVRAELDASVLAEDRILRSKVEFVERHRARLVKDSCTHRREAVKGYEEAIEALAQARVEVEATVVSERWAREFPGEDMDAASLRLALVKGGRLSKALPDLRTTTSVYAAFEWLRDDARWLGCVFDEEAKERQLDPHEHAIWEASEDGRKAIALANRRVEQGLRPKDLHQAQWD